MSEFFGGETYDAEIESPKGEKVTVTLRELNALDQAAIRDQSRMVRSDIDDEGGEVEIVQVPTGTMRMLAVQRAVVKWSLDQPPSKMVIQQIAPWFLDAIYEHVRLAGSTLLEQAAPEDPTTPATEAA